MPAIYPKFRIRARPILATGIVLGLGTVLTFASFTDSGIASTTFSTGTVDLALDAAGNDLPVWTTLGMENAKPGSVTYAPLTVTNAGSLDFTYTMAAVLAPGPTTLADALVVTIVDGSSTCDASAFDASATPLSKGSLSSATLDVRRLNAKTSTLPAESETFCFKVEVPSSAGKSLQGQSASATFTFTATQTA